MSLHRLSLLPLLAAAFLAACRDDADPARSAAAGSGEPSLPAPAGAPGQGVTGMPDRPGPGPVGPPQPDPALALDALGDRSGPADAAQPPAAGPPAPAAAEPTPEDAVQVVRDYYAAIDRGDYARAYALWSDGGRASDRTLEQFAQGFADTVSVEVEVMAPGPVDAGAGQRHIEVPVALTATHRDGGRHRFVGAYTLRRAVVDGATPEQRAWRIGSADLREVRP